MREESRDCEGGLVGVGRGRGEGQVPFCFIVWFLDDCCIVCVVCSQVLFCGRCCCVYEVVCGCEMGVVNRESLLLKKVSPC